MSGTARRRILSGRGSTPSIKIPRSRSASTPYRVQPLVWRAIATGDPPALAVIVVAVAGAVAAMFIQRYVIVVGTAFAGAWTIVLAIANAFPARGLTTGGSDSEVWILYPSSVPGRWAPVAWLALGVVGTAVQLSTNGRRR